MRCRPIAQQAAWRITEAEAGGGKISRRLFLGKGGGAAFYKVLKDFKVVKVIKVIRDIKDIKGFKDLND